jgi:hypothetical protein
LTIKVNGSSKSVPTGFNEVDAIEAVADHLLKTFGKFTRVQEELQIGGPHVSKDGRFC